jgi:hypothetical protein
MTVCGVLDQGDPAIGPLDSDKLDSFFAHQIVSGANTPVPRTICMVTHTVYGVHK